MGVKESDLKFLIAGMNKAAGHGENPPRDAIGVYRLGMAYGGYRLEKIVNESGGIRDISSFLTKRELFIFLRGYMQKHVINE